MNVKDHVNKKGDTRFIGVIDEIIGKFAIVNWGTADQRTFKEVVLLTDLEITKIDILSPDEVDIRRRNAIRHNIFDTKDVSDTREEPDDRPDTDSR